MPATPHIIRVHVAPTLPTRQASITSRTWLAGTQPPPLALPRAPDLSLSAPAPLVFPVTSAPPPAFLSSPLRSASTGVKPDNEEVMCPGSSTLGHSCSSGGLSPIPPPHLVTV